MSEEVSVNKFEVIDAINRSTSLVEREAEEAVNAFVPAAASEVSSDSNVVRNGFGTFNPTHRGGRVGTIPHTKAAVQIDVSRGMAFFTSTTVKDGVNGKVAMPKVTTEPEVSSTSTASTAGGSVKQVVRRSLAR